MSGLQVVLCGLGGQGIVFTAKVLAHAARLSGREVICSEIKGMAQRRASVVSFLKIGDFAGPAVRRGAADVAICLDPSELPTAASFVRAGGALLQAKDPAAAREASMELLGAAGILDPEVVRRAISDLSSEASRAANLGAFERGVTRHAAGA